jgi:hypothetical protein
VRHYHFLAGQPFVVTAGNLPRQQPAYRAQAKPSSRECSQSRRMAIRSRREAAVDGVRLGGEAATTTFRAGRR